MAKAYQIPPAPCDGSFTAAVGMSWGASPDFIYEEKINGVRAMLQIQPDGAKINYLTGRRIAKSTGEFVELQDQYVSIRDHVFPADVADTVIDGELAGGDFWFFDLVILQGRLMFVKPLRERRETLARLAAHFPAWLRPVPSSATAGDYLRGILVRGGEGIIRKNLNETHGFAWTKAKLEETHDVVILSVDAAARTMKVGQWKQKQLLELGLIAGLSPAEAAATAGQIGEAAEIICRYRDEPGRFHHAFFLRFRPDKSPADCQFDFEPLSDKDRARVRDDSGKPGRFDCRFDLRPLPRPA